MEPHAQLLALIAEVATALKQAQQVEECRDAHVLAQNLRSAAPGKKTPLRLRQQVACLAIEAERALGEAIAQAGVAKGTMGNQYSGKKNWSGNTVTGPKYLRDLQISKIVSSRAQLLARLSYKELASWLVEECERGKVPTITAARCHAKTLDSPPAPHIPLAPRGDAKEQPVTREDALTDLADIQKMLDRLLRRTYQGGIHKFTKAEGRLVRQRIADIGQAIRELGFQRRKDD